MYLMKSIYRTIWGAFSFLFIALVACTGNDVPTPEPLPEKEPMPIRWDVQSVSMGEGRALIENDMDLQIACTPGSGDKAIGIWSAYRLNGDSVKNVLGMNGDVNLIYNTYTSWDNWKGWTYGEEAAFWKSKAVYYFNAYFPKTGGLTSMANDSTSLKGTYHAETNQTDVLVHRVKVDTNNNFQGSPVYLPMKHALATLEFIFLMDGTDATGKLKSFSLNNSLKTTANFNYNTETITVDNWVDGTLSSKTRIYEWADNGGIPFTTTTGAMPYTTGSGIYQTNGGRILIIPQSCTVAPTFQCTIAEEGFDGDMSFEDVSLGTTLFEPGKNYIYTIKVKGRVISELRYQVEDWGEGGGNVEFN